MLSKTLCFNRTLFKKNLTRFWPLWGGASALGALLPLAVLVDIIQRGTWRAQDPLSATAVLYTALSLAVPGISLFFAVLCALAVWSYLFGARSVSLMHTLPITRKGLFITNTVSGLAMMLIPYAVTGVLSVLLMLVVGAFDPVGVLVTILGVLGISFFYFATATFAVFCTGSVFAMPVLYGLFHCLAYMLEWMLTLFTSLFYYGTTGSAQDITKILTPTYYLMSSLQVDTTSQEVQMPGYVTMKLSSVTLLGSGAIVLYTLVGAALMAGCWLLYRRRRSESAGDVVAVGWMKPVFRYGMAFCAAITGGMGLYALFWSGFQKNARADVLPMLICMALVGVIGYYIASMLLAKSLRVFKSGWKGAAVTAAAAAILCVTVSLDPLGVETRLPEAGDVEEIDFSVGANGYCGGSVTDPAAIRAILDAHSVLLSEREDLQTRTRSNMARNTGASDSSWVHVRMNYQLANGGRMTREYMFYYALSETERPGSAVSALAELVASPEIQWSNIFHSYYLQVDKDSVKFTGGDIRYLYDPQTGDTDLSLTGAQASALYDAICRDIEAGHFGRTLFEEERKNVYRTDLSLYYSCKVLHPDSSYHFVNDALNLDFSTYCTEILRTMESMGVLDGRHQLITYEEWDRIQEKENQDEAYSGMYDEPVEIAAAPAGAETETAIFVTGG